MRKEFEKLPEIADSLSEHIYFGGDGFYHSSLVNFQGLVNWLNGAWYAWQAAKAQEVLKGFVLMPKEPTKEIVEAFWNSWLVEQPNAQTMFFAYKAMIEARENS